MSSLGGDRRPTGQQALPTGSPWRSTSYTSWRFNERQQSIEVWRNGLDASFRVDGIEGHDWPFTSLTEIKREKAPRPG